MGCVTLFTADQVSVKISFQMDLCREPAPGAAESLVLLPLSRPPPRHGREQQCYQTLAVACTY